MKTSTQNKVINVINEDIKDVRELFNEIKSNLISEERDRIREKLYKDEAVYNFLKEKDSLTNIENRVLKNISRYLKRLKKDLEKLQKNQYNITYRLDYLFNELNRENYLKPKEIKSAFDGSYILYESRGDKDGKDAKLALWEYFDKIKPYLRDVIDNHKAQEKNH